ncbi:MAG TPA: hypothetical protein PLO62_00570 [Candidatus Hydrogenedentes bacterium]|nr:hypothetical protein [Candidatus Hydrogenedentota bacterium]HOS01611.1 hypothetical protein [Candidatus Hydrogenedentota bacterium]
MQTARRLEFDKEVLTEVMRPLEWHATRAAAWRVRAHRLAGIVVVLLAAGGAAIGAYSWFGWSRPAGAVAETARGIVEGLRTGAYDRINAVAAAHDDPPLQALSDFREELVRSGVSLGDAAPVAFGGVYARLKTAAEPVRAVTGNVYFLAGGRLYAVEVSLQDRGGVYVLTRAWQYQALDIPKEKAKTHAKALFEAFRKESALQPESKDLLRPAFLYAGL